VGVADERIQVQVGANISQLQAGMAGAVAAVRDSASDIVTQFSGMASRVSGAVAAVAAAVAGGKAFADVVDTTKEWTREAMQLARTLGITTEQASILNLALGDIYTSSETYLNAARMMQRQVNANGEGFKKLGVDIRDSNGHLRPTPELMQDVLEKINGLGTAQEKQAAGLMIFGRSWGEAQKLLKLNAQVLNDAREKAERLHLIVGPEGVAALSSYRAAMNDAEDAVTAIKVRAGNELLPVLANLGQWFAEVAPPAIDAAVSALQAIGSVLSMTTVQVALAALAFKAALLPALIQAGTAVVAWVQTVQVQMHLASMAWRTGPAVSQFQALTSAVLGSINPWLLIGAAVLAAGIGLERWITSASRAAEAQREAAQEVAASRAKFSSLVQEAERLDRAQNNAKASTEQKKRASEQLVVVIAQLNQVYPGFNQFLRDEAGNQRSIAEALKMATAAKREDLEIDIAILQVKLQKARALADERSAEAARAGARGAALSSGNILGQAASAWGTIQSARAADAAKAVKTLEQALDGLLGAKKALLDIPDLGGNHLGDDAPKLSPFDAISKAWEKQKALLISQGAEAEAYGRAAELAFWQSKISTLQKGSEDWVKATLKADDLRKQLDDEAKAANKKLEEEAAKHAAKMTDLAQARARGEAEAALVSLDAEEAALERRRQLGEISAEQELAALERLERRRFEIRMQGLEQGLDAESDVAKRREILNQLEQLEVEHQSRIKAIRGQAQVELAQQVTSSLQPLNQAIYDNTSAMLAQTQSLGESLQGVWVGVGRTANHIVSQMVTDWVAAETRKLAVTVLTKAKEVAAHRGAETVKTGATSQGVLSRLAMETWGAVRSVALAIWTGMKWIAIKAYEAAAGAYSAIASIPYVGPFLAPVMSAAALVAVLGMGSKIMSASKGFDIPAGVNPMTQLHEQEMVLPAKYANVIRGMAEGQGGGQASGDTFNVSMQFMDARGAEDFLRRNQGPLVRVMKDAVRNWRN